MPMNLYFGISNDDHYFRSNSSPEIKSGGYTRDGWTFEEAKIYESAMAQFQDTESMPFFNHVARLMPWQTMESIKDHGQFLLEDMTSIKSSDGNFGDILEDVMEMEQESRVGMEDQALKVTRRPKKKGIPWTEEEHRLFKKGLKNEGKGAWKAISKKYLPTKTPAQIASHAQKFETRQKKTPSEKRRRTINDIDDHSDSEPIFSSDTQGFKPNQLDSLSKSQDSQSNQLTFPLGSQGSQSNQHTIP